MGHTEGHGRCPGHFGHAERFIFSSVKVGERGQIVIPKDIREMFDIQAGENLAIVADKEKGIGILKEDVMQQFAAMMSKGLSKLSGKSDTTGSRTKSK